ncbi:hypothetical protein PJ985_19385 [Streptomyces sp. ACA25]|uniref:hypothetical protein n=1 Tax=Streptomyces sp. ACA25 TaxID=3022596 RepID=UPI0023075AE5|nr:hypothetical protein [Streptomyces sp. ACA25]MDB1089723.1 hypothetical protein [Streptomyces sp. ACA25]
MSEYGFGDGIQFSEGAAARLRTKLDEVEAVLDRARITLEEERETRGVWQGTSAVTFASVQGQENESLRRLERVVGALREAVGSSSRDTVAADAETEQQMKHQSSGELRSTLGRFAM